MLVRKEHISRYIPNRPPFIMMDNLLEADSRNFLTDFRVRPGNIFLDGEILREYALIENVAQSAASGMAWLHRHDTGRSLEGYLGGISEFELVDLPRIGDHILTQVETLQQVGNFYLFGGMVFLEERGLMWCKIALVGNRSKIGQPES